LKFLSCEDCSNLQRLPDLSKCRLQRLWLKGCVSLNLKEMRVGSCSVSLD
jgi:hypothetical protein